VGTPRAVQGLTSGVAQLVETGADAAQLAEAVVRLIRDPEFARRRGIEGRLQVMADYSWGAALDYLLQLVENPDKRVAPPAVSARQVETGELLGKEQQ
jgi:glycosyltransferase involved in cell wall biosynthesis